MFSIAYNLLTLRFVVFSQPRMSLLYLLTMEIDKLNISTVAQDKSNTSSRWHRADFYVQPYH